MSKPMKPSEEAFRLAKKPDEAYRSLLVEVYLSQAEMALSNRKFRDAKRISQAALDEASPEDKETFVRASSVLGLAQAFSGEKTLGRMTCEKAVALANEIGDPVLLAKARLSLAEALPENGEKEEALRTVLQLQEGFAKRGQTASEWQVWTLAARTSGMEGQKVEYEERAAQMLSVLQQRWGAPGLSHIHRQTRYHVRYQSANHVDEYKEIHPCQRKRSRSKAAH
ncbi:MAG: hypothetical protein WKF84_08360 [Pyrinomonadaceae bacterium]